MKNMLPCHNGELVVTINKRGYRLSNETLIDMDKRKLYENLNDSEFESYIKKVAIIEKLTPDTQDEDMST